MTSLASAPFVSWYRPRHRWRLLQLLCGACTIVGCDQPVTLPPTPIAPQAGARFATIVAPVTDKAMGAFSPLARHVSAALRDSSIRMALVQAMKDSSALGSGLDLQNCAQSSVAKEVLAEGERHGAGSATQLCAVLTSLSGAVLYMDPQRLQAWDGRATPIVTALSDPRAALPDSIVGYRTPSRTIKMAARRLDDGPLLVILPYAHPRTSGTRRITSATQVIRVQVPDSATVRRAP